ncbi:hypothetical protein ACIRN4_06280 [Pimelobacter simplex]|uniref:hypothetical protein n=1 Tax=Nocardioides simplex TaxID=2045 RepID=UPI0038233630
MSLPILAIVALYLAVGTAYARQRTEQGRPTSARPEFAVLESAGHERGCDLRNAYRPEVCDCTLREDWEAARRTVREWDRRQVPPTTSEVYGRLLFWPLLIHRALMSPPPHRESRRERRMRHELENARHIAEITAITSGNQQAIAGAMNPLEIELRDGGDHG